MLTQLRITGFAVVDEVDVRFGPGLNVLTGETGAGKSILVNALHLVLGGRMGADVLREGCDEATVEAIFELPAAHPVFARLAAAGVEAGETEGRGPAARRAERAGAEHATGELLVRRVVSRSGRGRVYVNGALATVGMLEAAMRGVVDVCGQHEHVSLLDPALHLELLDAYAGLGEARASYGEAFAELAALHRERQALELDEAERARRADYLAFQLEELEAADPRVGEDQKLEQERRVLASAEKLRSAAQASAALAWEGESSAHERAAQALRSLGDLAQLDPRLDAVTALLRSAIAELEEAGRELARYADGAGGDPQRLAEVEERLECLKRLARKHGGTLEAAIARREGMKAELAGLAGAGERRGELDALVAAVGARAVALAAELSKARRKAAKAFGAEVEAELAQLAMARCGLELAFAPVEGGVAACGARLGPEGAERGELLLAPNPGEPPRPLAKIASGGELSRVLLAVKRALSKGDPVATYVFDEVDAGVGGAVAEAMGRLLHEVSRGRQVICVTHLPQIAAFGDRHHRVEKRVERGRTATRVLLLDAGDDRRTEVARMLAGVTVTASALEHARELIDAAHKPRREGRRPAPPRQAARVARR